MGPTHVEVADNFSVASNHIELNGDGIGYLESYDFSTANLSEESRIACISTVASVCYGNPKAKGSISLYNRLANESAGLPSSSFEFVPILLPLSKIGTPLIVTTQKAIVYGYENSLKYGQIVEDSMYLLTNLRALIADVGDKADQFYNTSEECAIIARHHRVFKAKIDIATRTQYIRHRVSWQELSRRYVSGKKSPFEFYISPKMKSLPCDTSSAFNPFGKSVSTEQLIDLCVNHYDEALSQGVKPEEARRILPQAMYTTIWSAWLPSQLESFYTLRLDSHAQSEIRELAAAMKQSTKGTN